MNVIAPIAAISAVLACITWVVLAYRKQAQNILDFPPKN